MTHNLAGTLIPDDCLADLRLAARTGQAVFQKTFSPDAGACHNCAGVGHVWFQFVTGGPFRSPDPRGKAVSTFHDGQWWTVDSRLYPCPACNADQRARLQALWLSAGLEVAERDWRLEWLDAYPGKELALEAARSLLAGTPRPAGWLVLHGGYGRGKSGMLKSLVAAFVRAGVAAHYCRAADILAAVRSSYGHEPGPSEVRLFSEYDSWPCLAVDEVDRIGGSAWAMATLAAVLDRRYNRRESHATVLATNADPERMPPEWGYLMSRMKDGSRVPVGGADLRGRVAEPELPEWAHA